MAGTVPLDMEIAQVAHSALERIFETDEPFPAFEEGDRATLEMCCQCTEAGAYGHEQYPDLPSKAAKLFYSTIKSHPFLNGNKRFAVVLTIVFLIINRHRLTAAQGVSYEVAKAIAESDPHSPEGSPERQIDNLTDFFRNNIEPYDWFAQLVKQQAKPTS